MDEQITVYKPGFKVQVGSHADGIVTGVLIKANGSVLYEVAWWSSLEYKSGWFQECEIRRDERTQLRIGFVNA